MGISFFRFVTIQTFDRRRGGGQTDVLVMAKTALHICSKVKSRLPAEGVATSKQVFISTSSENKFGFRMS